MKCYEKCGAVAALLGMLGSASFGCRPEPMSHTGKHADTASDNYAPTQAAAGNYPLTLEFVVPPVGKAIKANRNAFPKDMKAEDLGFYYVTPPIRYVKEEKQGDISDYREQPVMRALGPYFDSLSARPRGGIVRDPWNIRFVRDENLSKTDFRIPLSYEDPSTPESRANSTRMEEWVKNAAGERNFMRARDASERNESREDLLYTSNVGRGLIKFVGTAIGPGCQPCRYFVFAPRRPR